MPFQNSWAFWELELSNSSTNTFDIWKKRCLTIDLTLKFSNQPVWRRCLIGTHLTTTEYHSGQKGKQASEFLFCFQTVDYKNSGGVVVTMTPYNITRVKMLPLKEKKCLKSSDKINSIFLFQNMAPQAFLALWPKTLDEWKAEKGWSILENHLTRIFAPLATRLFARGGL